MSDASFSFLMNDFLDANIKIPATLDHTQDPEFRRLAERCGRGDANAMNALANYFGEKARKTQEEKPSTLTDKFQRLFSDKKDVPEQRISGAQTDMFYKLASNFWRFRACAKGSPEAAQRIESWKAENPSKKLPSVLAENYETLLDGYNTTVSGALLNALGFPFFDRNTEYYLHKLATDGLVLVSKTHHLDEFEGENGTWYYDWWFMDENLREITSLKILPCCRYSEIYEELKASGKYRAEALEALHNSRHANQ